MTTSPEARVRELAREKNISPEEAERLLAALGSPAPVRVGRNPFERWRGERTALAGILIALAGIAVSRLGVRFDGALDLHIVGAPVPAATAIVDQLAAFPLTALVLWGAARLLSRHTRFVDIAGAVSVARAPLVLIAVPLAFLPMPPTEPLPTSVSVELVLIALLGLAGLGAQLLALVLGVRAASGLRSGKLAAAVVGGVLAAEVLSKVLIWLAS